MAALKKTLVFVFIVFMGLAALATAQKQAYRAEKGPEGVQRAEITGGSYFFKPRHIILKVNVPAEFTLKKERTLTPHAFVVKAPEAGMDIKVKLGTEPKKISFTPTKTGKYEFYCDEKLLFFPSHRKQGMKGMLEVTE